MEVKNTMLDCKSPWFLLEDGEISSRNAGSDPSEDSSSNTANERPWRKVLKARNSESVEGSSNGGNNSDLDAAGRRPGAVGPGFDPGLHHKVFSESSSINSQSQGTSNSNSCDQTGGRGGPMLASLPSLGSAEHHTGGCKPCLLFHKDKASCKQGSQCRYCHVEGHEVAESSGKTRMRPGKGKRDRYQKFAQKVIGMIDKDPESFNLSDVRLPPSIAGNERLKSKFTRRMQGHVEIAGGDGASSRGHDCDVDSDTPETRPPASSASASGAPPRAKKIILSL